MPTDEKTTPDTAISKLEAKVSFLAKENAELKKALANQKKYAKQLRLKNEALEKSAQGRRVHGRPM